LHEDYTSKTFFQFTTYVLALALSALAIYAPFPRGMFFREDYLRFFPWVAWACLALGVLSLFGSRRVWYLDLDVFLLLVTALYSLTTIWAVSKGQAINGALKYTSYLMVFLMARYLGATPLSNRLLRNGLIFSGLVASLVGLLAAAKVILYPSAVVSGRIYGSFQYPNALAAYAMFISFFCFHAWLESESFRRKWARLFSGVFYSSAAFCLMSVIILSYSRATWMIFGFSSLLYLLLLPSGIRARIFWRFASTVVAVLAINRQVADALPKENHLVIREYLLIGATIAAALEISRLFLTEIIMPSLSKSKKTPFDSGQVSSSSAGSDSSQKALGRRKVLLALSGAFILVILLTALFTTSLGQSFLGKIVPESVVRRFSSISLLDRSLVIRFLATKDAFLIAKDHPFGTGAGGWNALYHQYQRTLYWFTETHNHFAQVLVETGFFGLFFYVLFWVGIAYTFIQALMGFRRCADVMPFLSQTSKAGTTAKSGTQRKARLSPANLDKATTTNSLPDDGSPRRLWFSGIVSSGVAIFSLGLHSSADFDLSLPSMSIALFLAIGVFLSQTEAFIHTERFVGNMVSLVVGRFRKSTKRDGRREQAKEDKKGKESVSGAWRIAEILVIVAMAVSVIKPCKSYFRGMVLGSQGVYNIMNGDLEGGRQFLLAAMKYDPHTSSYAMDLARTYAQDYEEYRDEASKGMVKVYLDLARRLDPLNLQDRLNGTMMLYAVGLYDDSVNSARNVVELCPLDRNFHDVLANCAKTAISEHLGAWQKESNDGNEQAAEGHVEYIKRYSAWIREIPEVLLQKKEAVTGIYAKVWNSDELNITGGISLALGQAYYLGGDKEKALSYLSSAMKDQKLAHEASNWLYCLSQVSDVKVSLPGAFKPDQNLTQLLTRAYGLVR